MFSKLIIVYGLVAVALCLPQQPETPRILEQNQEVNPDGSFRWGYLSSDGSAQDQAGRVEERPGEEPVLNVAGRASWIDPEGKSHEISYTAGEGGYSATSADVPRHEYILHPALRRAKLYLLNNVENPEP